MDLVTTIVISFRLCSGSSSNGESNQALRQMAVYIANLFYLTSDAFVPVLRDKDVVEGSLHQRNLIVLGETSENSFISPYLEKSSLSFENNHVIKLGKSYASLVFVMQFYNAQRFS